MHSQGMSLRAGEGWHLCLLPEEGGLAGNRQRVLVAMGMGGKGGCSEGGGSQGKKDRHSSTWLQQAARELSCFHFQCSDEHCQARGGIRVRQIQAGSSWDKHAP